MLFYLLILILIILFWGIYFLILKLRKRVVLKKSMELILLSVAVPHYTPKDKESSLKEQLKAAQQFFGSLANLKESKSKILPTIIFEIAVHRNTEEIHFYVATPRKIAQQIEKQIVSFWPQAQVQKTNDFNIFNPSGESTGYSIVLDKNNILPLKNSEEFGVDPISNLTSVFTKLARDGEGAAIQILIKPHQDKSIKKSAQNIINAPKKGQKLDDLIKGLDQKNFLKIIFKEAFKKAPEKIEKSVTETTPQEQEIISAISNKFSQPLFQVNLRILSSATNKERAEEILSQIGGSFEQFNTINLNRFKVKKLSSRKLKKLFYLFSFRIFDPRCTFILSAEELGNIFHFPPSGMSTPYLEWIKNKQAPPPTNLPSEGLVLGKNIFRGEERQITILENDRRRHFYAVGQTGTGKSVLLREMIKQDMESGKGVALIDPHGDLAQEVLSLVPIHRVKDVIYFDPNDIERPIGLNMLDYDTRFPATKTLVINEVLEIFEKLYNLKAMGFGGPMFEQYMRNALLLIMEHPESGNTLIEVPRVLADKDFRNFKLSHCRNLIVKNFWEQEAEKAGGEAALANMVPYLTSKMNVFIANDLVRPIIAQQESSFNFRQIIDTGKIFIVNLSKGKLGDTNSYLLGMIIVGKILIAAFSRADISEEDRKDFYLYIDEFHNVTTKSIVAGLSEARKYRLSLILAHQFIGQLDEDTRKAIFGNVGSILALRMGIEDAKYLTPQFEPIFNENDIASFDNYYGVLKLLINGESREPFNISTFPPSPGDLSIAELAREYSRINYGRDKNIVEEDLYQRLKKSYF